MANSNIDVIKTFEALKELLSTGITLKGPRDDHQKNMDMIERFFQKEYIFFPETLLLNDGYQVVEPSTFTKGLQFAFKTSGEDMKKYYKSHFSLLINSNEIPLYLEYTEKE